MIYKKKAFQLLLCCLFVYLVGSSIATSTTKAWFITESQSQGKVVHATTEDLLDVDATVLSYDTDCVIWIEMKIKNISDVAIPIEIDERSIYLAPGEVFSEVFERKVSCEANELRFQLIGFNRFIGEFIVVPLQPSLLKKTAVNRSVDIEIEKQVKNQVQTPDKQASDLHEQ
ncbi:hypothetical protein GT022_12100 [Agaribacter marinus]|uniref:DUF4352 domain-containing protein n=1 Tax=Virgibacillus salarius TaxID=447199 RepID=A0A941IBW1_9BACI|nr:hypothetical protein [Virgibacillus salarius]MBR7796787.1 hypothetical protein [Virgibacillus salarius]NAZ09497.1 hypothetical protein [Agaribacter marinus]